MFPFEHSKSPSEEQLLTEIEAKARENQQGQLRRLHHQDRRGRAIPDRGYAGSSDSVSAFSQGTRRGPCCIYNHCPGNLPRINQNTVYLLVHEMAEIVAPSEGYMFSPNEERKKNTPGDFRSRANRSCVMKRLKDDPQNYGIRIQHLQDQDFEAKLREREKPLNNDVSQA